MTVAARKPPEQKPFRWCGRVRTARKLAGVVFGRFGGVHRGRGRYVKARESAHKRVFSSANQSAALHPTRY